MEYDEIIYNINELSRNQLKQRLILLGEELEFEDHPKQFYADLYKKCLTTNPTNIEIIKKYESNIKEKTDTMIRKRNRDSNNELINTVPKEKISERNENLTSSAKRYIARPVSFTQLNYPTTDIMIQSIEEVVVNPMNINNIPIVNTKANNVPRSPNRVDQNKECNCPGTLIQNKVKIVNTMNVKNLIGVGGIMGLSGLSYCSFQEREHILKILQPFLAIITNLINSHDFLIKFAALFGFFIFIFVLKKLKEIMDRRLESLAQKIIFEAEKKLTLDRFSNSIESEAFVEEYCIQNKIWMNRRCIMNEITRILQNSEEKLVEKVSKKTWVLK
jgi:predicted metal-binding protein